jgi:hypothetical protein
VNVTIVPRSVSYSDRFLPCTVLLFVNIRQLSVVGDQFKVFMIAYLTFRFAVDFIKPAVHIGGLSTIQWAALAVIAYYAPHVPRLFAEVRHGWSRPSVPLFMTSPCRSAPPATRRSKAKS